MSSSLSKIWIHAFFSTKNRAPLITKSLEHPLYHHVRDHLEHDFHCSVEEIGGTADHLHVLYLLNPNYAVKDILKNLKGESSHWINAGDFLDSKFAWQKAYTAFSVSDAMLKPVRRHIEEQRRFHSTVSFLEEQTQLLSTHRLAQGR